MNARTKTPPQGRPARADARRQDGGHRPRDGAATSSRSSASTAPRAIPSPRRATTSRMSIMFVPKPVISLAIKPKDNKMSDNLGKALARFIARGPDLPHLGRRGDQRDDHRRHGRAAPRRLRRAHEARVQLRGRDRRAAASPTASASRAAPTTTTRTRSRPAARASTRRSAATSSRSPARTSFEFVNEVRGGSIPTEYIPACEKGFASALSKGDLIGAPVLGVQVVLNDGAVARGRLLGPRLPGRRALGVPRGLRGGQARDPGADHEARGRRARATSRAPT